MITLEEVEGTKHTTEALALLCKKLGYKGEFDQLSFNNGATASNIFEFFDDNPGAIAAVVEFIIEHKNLYNIAEDAEDESDQYIEMVVNEGKINAIKQYRLDKGVLLKDASVYINKLLQDYISARVIEHNETEGDYFYA
jgi:ribosomal protein L7/L12